MTIKLHVDLLGIYCEGNEDDVLRLMDERLTEMGYDVEVCDYDDWDYEYWCNNSTEKISDSDWLSAMKYANEEVNR